MNEFLQLYRNFLENLPQRDEKEMNKKINATAVFIQFLDYLKDSQEKIESDDLD